MPPDQADWIFTLEALAYPNVANNVQKHGNKLYLRTQQQHKPTT